MTTLQPSLMDAAMAEAGRWLPRWNILRLLELSGRVDVGRLRAALAVAQLAHPLAVARRVYGADGTWHWGIEPRDVVQVDVLPGGYALDELLQDVLAERLQATQAPALRCFVLRGPQADALLFNFCHERTDGTGANAYVGTVLQAYAGRPVTSQAGMVAARHPLAAGERVEPMAPGLLMPEPIHHLSPAPPYERRTWQSFALALPLPLAAVLRSAQALQVTVGELLVASVAAGIERWSVGRGQKPGRVCVAVPVNARPAEDRAAGFCNAFGTLFTNTGQAERLSLAAAATAAAQQVRQWRPAVVDRAQAAALRTAPARHGTEPARLPDALIPTASVSSLGTWPGPVHLADDCRVIGVWAPALPLAPMGLTLSAVGLGERLCVALRFPCESLGRDDAEDLAATILQCLVA